MRRGYPVLRTVDQWISGSVERLNSGSGDQSNVSGWVDRDVASTRKAVLPLAPTTSWGLGRQFGRTFVSGTAVCTKPGARLKTNERTPPVVAPGRHARGVGCASS
eukprot:7677177-Pyramimonas_sp.AAC.1